MRIVVSYINKLDEIPRPRFIKGDKMQEQQENETAEDKVELAGQWSDHFEISTKKESLRAKVVLSVCYLDEVLDQLLKIVLKPSDSKNDLLFNGPQAPLGTFSSKIEMTYRMGLISKEIKDSLNYIRKIRNEFAHNLLESDFSNPKILGLNRNLYKLNNSAMRERRKIFSEGEIGNFEAVVSLMIFLIRIIIQDIPVTCPCCGDKMTYRERIKHLSPTENQ